MGDHNTFKEDQERSAGDRFVSLHNFQGHHNFAFKEQPTSDPPDLIYEDRSASKILLLEMTAIYYNGEYAAWIWKDRRGMTPSSEISCSPTIVGPTLAFCTFLNRLIEQKCKQRFSDPILLVLDNETFTPITDVQDCINSHLAFPSEVPFQEVWLLQKKIYSSGTRDKQETRSPKENLMDIPLEEVFPPEDSRFRLYPRQNREGL